MDQTGSSWISHQSKNATIKSCHICRKSKNDCFVFDFLDQICPKWIKLDQNGFLTNQKVFLLKVFTFTKIIKMAVLFLIFLGSDLSKMDQT